MTTIRLRHIRIHVDDRSIVEDLSLDIPQQTLVGIIGPNGAGKTTLAKAIVNLIKPDAGQIHLFKQPIEDYSKSELARTIAFLPQDAPVHWPISVREVVTLGRFAHMIAAETTVGLDQAITDALRATDTYHLQDRSIAHLSGGEYARVMLARTLAAHAPIMIVDEPIASLDPYHQLHVMEILKEYAASGNTVIAILHDLTLAGRFCDRIVMMKDGVIVGDGPPQEILRPAVIESTYEVQTIEGEHRGEKYVIPWQRRS